MNNLFVVLFLITASALALWRLLWGLVRTPKLRFIGGSSL